MIAADCIAFVSVEQKNSRRPRKPFADRLELDEETGCWNWSGATDRDGYGIVKRAGKRFQAHRLAYERLVGTIPAGACVLHSCDNPACCHPDHLRPGTAADNVRDAIDRGRFVAPRQKLTLAQVDEIRKSPATGVELGKKFGVSASTICDARRGKTFTSKSVNYEAI